MSPSESIHSTTARPEYSNISEAHENDLKSNFMVMIDLLNEKMNKSLKEIEEMIMKNWRTSRYHLKNVKNVTKITQLKEMNESDQDRKMEIE